MKSLMPICKLAVNQIWLWNDIKYVVISIRQNRNGQLIIVNKTLQHDGVTFEFETEIKYFLEKYKLS